MCETEKVPEWLEHLEKPKPFTLGHEFGFGALCCACTFCSGMQLHFWRKICMSCGCRLDDHDVEKGGYPQYQLIFGQNKRRNELRTICFEGKETYFDWLPSADSLQIIGEYLKSLTKNHRPISGTNGSEYRTQQLGRQLPRYDVDRSDFPLSTEYEIANFRAYRNQLLGDAAGSGFLIKLGGGKGIYRSRPAIVFQTPESEEVQELAPQFAQDSRGVSKSDHCRKCDLPFAANGVVVSVSKLQDAYWHANCFICTVCGELLVDLHYFTHDGKIYCGRDYAVAVKKQRCIACDEIIFEREYTFANCSFYHNRHFCCITCDIPLGGKQYMHKNGNFMCLSCSEQRDSQVCNTCRGRISVMEQRFKVCGHVYHKNEGCFRCHKCLKPVVVDRIFSKNSKLLCESCIYVA